MALIGIDGILVGLGSPLERIPQQWATELVWPQPRSWPACIKSNHHCHRVVTRPRGEEAMISCLSFLCSTPAGMADEQPRTCRAGFWHRSIGLRASEASPPSSPQNTRCHRRYCLRGWRSPNRVTAMLP